MSEFDVCENECCMAELRAEIERLESDAQISREVDKLACVEIAKLKELLVEVAGIAHHGALLGFKTMPEAQTKICRLTVDYWDRDECSRLQSGAAK